MQFEKWCSDRGGYLNDKDDGARAAKLMAANAWDAAVAAERERCAKVCDLHLRLTGDDDRQAQSHVLETEIWHGASRWS